MDTAVTVTNSDSDVASNTPLYYIPLYYLFHILYTGHPAQILRRLWLVHDEAHPSGPKPVHGRESTSTTLSNTPQSPSSSSSAWKAFDETLKESYRNAGLMVSSRFRVSNRP